MMVLPGARGVGYIAAGAGSDLERAVANQDSLQKSLASLKIEAASTSRDQIRLRELEREAEAERAVYGTFLTRARETGEQVSIDTTNARVITPAEPPYGASWPPRLILLAGAGLIGLSFGAGLALLREAGATARRTVLLEGRAVRA